MVVLLLVVVVLLALLLLGALAVTFLLLFKLSLAGLIDVTGLHRTF
jgi:hypothetical protein